MLLLISVFVLQVYVDVDSAGFLVAGGAGGGGAALCVRAALAPNVHARTALLTAPTHTQTSWPVSAETLVSFHTIAQSLYIFPKTTKNEVWCTVGSQVTGNHLFEDNLRREL